MTRTLLTKFLEYLYLKSNAKPHKIKSFGLTPTLEITKSKQLMHYYIRSKHKTLTLQDQYLQNFEKICGGWNSLINSLHSLGNYCIKPYLSKKYSTTGESTMMLSTCSATHTQKPLITYSSIVPLQEQPGWALESIQAFSWSQTQTWIFGYPNS